MQEDYYEISLSMREYGPLLIQLSGKKKAAVRTVEMMTIRTEPQKAEETHARKSLSNQERSHCVIRIIMTQCNLLVVFAPDAIVQPFTMVVEFGDTFVTDGTVFGLSADGHITDVTKLILDHMTMFSAIKGLRALFPFADFLILCDDIFIYWVE